MQRLIKHLTSSEILQGAPSYQRYQKAQSARYDDKSTDIHPASRTALSRIGIDELYLHQAEALRAFNGGANPLVVTPTASGKSLVYQLAILEELQRDPEARMLLLFPLKALERDQLGRLQELLELSGLSESCSAAIVDGDTSRDEREKLRAHPPNLMLTNPDMLHYGILPYHRGWSSFFRNLRFIVIDELHIYRGIFGSHVLQILRRLDRICRFYGSPPRWIAGSATIGNPLELAEELTGADFTLIERSGAPTSGRHFLFLNPVDSPYTLATRVLPDVLKKGYKAIAFTKSRRATELLHKWILDANPKLENRLSSYRAGFLPEERRDIEKRLLSDKLSGVISTSALELGMDIGGIDVCLLLGYPGTISTMMQRAGRAGRGERDSLVILIAGEDALDQYFMRHPDQLFLRPSEAAIVDGSNADINKSHVVCAAAEIPIVDKDPYLTEERREQIGPLVDQGKLIPGSGGKRWFPGIPKPHRQLNIRSMGESYSIHNSDTGRQIGDIGGGRLWNECHPQAIYMHRARQYLIESIDDGACVVKAKPSDLDYYTMALGEKETEILSRQRELDLGCGKAVEGELKVTQRVTGFQKRRLYGGQLLSTHELDGPPQILITRGFWLEMNDELQSLTEERHYHYMGSLHATEHALISVFPLEVMCDRGDVGGISFVHNQQVGGAAIFFYDAYQGGLGITRRAFERLDSLIGRTLSLVKECPCEDGCPSCVHSPQCGAGNRPLDKQGSIFLMAKALEVEETGGKRAEVTELPEALERETEPTKEKPVILHTLPEWTSGKRIISFDLETQRGPDEVGGWGNTHLMGLSLAVVQDLSNGECQTYREDDVDELIELLFNADLVIGFNCVKFDFGVLAGYSGRDFSGVNVLDLLLLVHKNSGKRRSLDSLANYNLGKGKSGTGQQALRYYREGRWKELEEYCRMDVEITADLFFLVLHTGRLKLQSSKGNVDHVDCPLNLKSILSSN
ncbi:DEAD/DEAH box helicase [candidate division LCP-89 bacterium B3_LCP]|uniref:DEAD/DEAH box helicase n=1 Tax=candidate division LCP-89 bacterium B3_LCP TaxID=2012998 RepID=A0A532UVX3_UNCL8|nr:MAG: DEAD/DEAH box helicase [candidate division LCP-89 bacterium B3_LCP]